jgi:general secretion pathway protein K
VTARFKQQRGVALIMAILMVALATILAVSVATEGYMDQRRTSTVIEIDHAYEVALGAEALAAQALQIDTPTTDSLNQYWARPIAYPLDDGIGEIQGHLEDLQGRFNINKVLNPDGTKNPTGVRQFQRLLELLNIDTRYATLLVDWIDADSNPEFPDGAEDSTYAGQQPPYLTANMPVTRTSELMSLVGMKQEDYLKLEPYIAALPLDSKLNVCTASPLVLDSLSGTLSQYRNNVDALTSSRASGCFPNINDVKTSFGGDTDFKQLMQDHADYLAETTSYFRANILVTIGTTELALYSVLSRVSTGANAKTRVIQRSFGTN